MKQSIKYALMLIGAVALVCRSCDRIQLRNSVRMLFGSSDRMQLEAFVKKSNNACPLQAEEYAVCTKIQMHGDFVELFYKVDETDADGEEFSVADLNDIVIKEDMKKTLIEECKELYNSDKEDFIKLCKKCKVGLEYRYVGKRTGGECVIRIEYWELP